MTSLPLIVRWLLGVDYDAQASAGVLEGFNSWWRKPSESQKQKKRGARNSVTRAEEAASDNMNMLETEVQKLMDAKAALAAQKEQLEHELRLLWGERLVVCEQLGVPKEANLCCVLAAELHRGHELQAQLQGMQANLGRSAVDWEDCQRKVVEALQLIDRLSQQQQLQHLVPHTHSSPTSLPADTTHTTGYSGALAAAASVAVAAAAEPAALCPSHPAISQASNSSSLSPLHLLAARAATSAGSSTIAASLASVSTDGLSAAQQRQALQHQELVLAQLRLHLHHLLHTAALAASSAASGSLDDTPWDNENSQDATQCGSACGREDLSEGAMAAASVSDECGRSEEAAWAAAGSGLWRAAALSPAGSVEEGSGGAASCAGALALADVTGAPLPAPLACGDWGSDSSQACSLRAWPQGREADAAAALGSQDLLPAAHPEVGAEATPLRGGAGTVCAFGGMRDSGMQEEQSEQVCEEQMCEPFSRLAFGDLPLPLGRGYGSLKDLVAGQDGDDVLASRRDA